HGGRGSLSVVAGEEIGLAPFGASGYILASSPTHVPGGRHDPSAPAPHRRPAHPQLRRQDHFHLRRPRRSLRPALRPLPRPARPRTGPPLPAPPPWPARFLEP